MKKYLAEILKIQNDLGVNEIFDFLPNRDQNLLKNFLKPIENSIQKQSQSTKNLGNFEINASTIQEINELIKNFEGCELKKSAKNTVCNDGNHNAKIMLVGEAPGEEEDEKAIPFCGRSGILLEKMLNSIGLFREKNLFITNTIFWRPPNNRKPTEEEILQCRPFLDKTIEILNPRIIILCGSTALESFLGKNSKISSMLGNFYDYKNYKTFPIYHPSYCLRNPISKKIMWQNLLLLLKYLEDNSIV